MRQHNSQDNVHTFGIDQAKIRNQMQVGDRSQQIGSQFTPNNSKIPRPFHRKYHKLSDFSPDQAFVIKYLDQRGYHQTSKLFQKQIGNAGHGQNQFDTPITFIKKSIQRLFQKEKITNSQEIQTFFDDLEKSHKISQLIPQNRILNIKFLIYIWVITKIQHTELLAQHRKKLQKFIQKNGDSLAENDQLLPYFALSYIQTPKDHPFLRQIYEQAWKTKIYEKIYKMLKEQKKQKQNEGNLDQKQQNPQIEWYLFFRDLVQISSNVCDSFEALHKIQDPKLQSMIKRIRQYEKVLQDSEQFINNKKEAQRRAIFKEPKREKAKQIIELEKNKKKHPINTISDTSKSDLSKTSKFIQQLEVILQKQGSMIFMNKKIQQQQSRQSQKKGILNVQVDNINFQAIKQAFQSCIAKHETSKVAERQGISLMDNIRKVISYLQCNQRKQFVGCLIKVDILSICQPNASAIKEKPGQSKKTHTTNQEILLFGLGSRCEQFLISFLLFLNKICSFYVGRNYILQKCMNTILPICNSILISIVMETFPKHVISQNKSELYLYNNNSNRKSRQTHRVNQSQQKIINCILTLLVKLSIRQQVTIFLARAGIIKPLQLLVQNYSSLEKQTFTYCAALIMYLLLGQNSRALSASFPIFENICTILNLLASSTSSQEQFEQVQSYMHSIIYLLMNQREFREKAQQVNLPDLLAQNMVKKDNQFYTKQVQHIINKISENQEQGSQANLNVIDSDTVNDQQQQQEGEQQQIQLESSQRNQQTSTTINQELLNFIKSYSIKQQVNQKDKIKQQSALLYQKQNLNTSKHLPTAYRKENYLWRKKAN